jgi:hypothetical protein
MEEGGGGVLWSACPVKLSGLISNGFRIIRNGFRTDSRIASGEECFPESSYSKGFSSYSKVLGKIPAFIQNPFGMEEGGRGTVECLPCKAFRPHFERIPNHSEWISNGFQNRQWDRAALSDQSHSLNGLWVSVIWRPYGAIALAVINRLHQRLCHQGADPDLRAKTFQRILYGQHHLIRRSGNYRHMPLWKLITEGLLQITGILPPNGEGGVARVDADGRGRSGHGDGAVWGRGEGIAEIGRRL